MPWEYAYLGLSLQECKFGDVQNLDFFHLPTNTDFKKFLLVFEICARDICEKQYNILKISLLFKKLTNFTGK